MDKLQQAINTWQSKTFPNGSAHSMLSHLCEEILELSEIMKDNNDDPNRLQKISKELADCQHLLFGIASKFNINLYTSTVFKFEENKKKKMG
jgi:NTP pyrophosphatase (non-canonical NTP hydrolase)